MAHIILNSVRNKFEPFREVLLENIFDMLSIHETKLDDSFPDAQFNVSRYKCYRDDYTCNEGGLVVLNDMIWNNYMRNFTGSLKSIRLYFK